MPKDKRTLLWPLVIVLLVGTLASWGRLEQPSFLELVELKAYDARMRLRGKLPWTGQVVIAAIDEESIRRVGRWPWSREKIAELVDVLNREGARAVGFDVGFFDPQNSPGRDELINLIKQAPELGMTPTPELRKYIRRRLDQSDADGAMIHALAKTQAPFYLGYYLNLNPEEQGDCAAAVRKPARYAMSKSLGAAPKDRSVAQTEPQVPEAAPGRTVFPPLLNASTGQAYFNVIPDMDGVVRRYQMALRCGRELYQPLAAALFNVATPESLPSVLTGPGGVLGVEWGEHVARTDEQGAMMLNYRAGNQSAPHVPVWSLLDDEHHFVLKGKYVIVGVTAPAVYDMRPTPLDAAFSGVEIHATALDNLLRQDYLTRPAWAPLADLTAVWILCLLAMLVTWRARPLWAVLGMLVFGGGYFALNVYFFAQREFWLNLTCPLGGFFLAFFVLSINRFASEERRRRIIRGVFARYIDHSVVQKAVDSSEELTMKGEERQLSVLWAGVSDFGRYSEPLDAQKAVLLLQQHLTAMTELLLKHKGMLDKYHQEALQAMFGAPFALEEPALHACRAAHAMCEQFVKTRNKIWAPGQDTLSPRLCMGVSTGQAVVGNIGSEQRLTYSAVGRPVGVAERLMRAARRYGVSVVIDEQTQILAGQHFWARPLDKLPGRPEPFEIFELLGPIELEKPMKYLGKYLEMYEAYQNGEFQTALDLVLALVKEHPDDKVLNIYEKRCASLAVNPPVQWRGVFDARHGD